MSLAQRTRGTHRRIATQYHPRFDRKSGSQLQLETFTRRGSCLSAMEIPQSDSDTSVRVQPHTPAEPFSPSHYSPLSTPHISPTSPYSFLPPTTSSSHAISWYPLAQPRRYGCTLFAADFRPIRTLGKGGHGTTHMYLVENPVSERQPAIKAVKKNGLRVRDYPAVCEDQAVARVGVTGVDTAPGLVPLIGSFEEGQRQLLLADEVGNLTKVIKQDGAWSTWLE
ncbi:hypothetical protein C8Q80DRAFT_1358031 [Daedaleopsis nitida]|nr:hypothetical protein C8Q80DRAFT_1358031 [Daedaleopsis nitida]